MAQTNKKKTAKTKSKGSTSTKSAREKANGAVVNGVDSKKKSSANKSPKAKSKASSGLPDGVLGQPSGRKLAGGGMTSKGRLGVHKTYKMWVGGKFVRSEQGRVMPLLNSEGELVTNVVRASRKDFRDAVVAARAAQGPWNKRTAFNRSQILFRIAEMIDARCETLIARLQEHAGVTAKAAAAEVDAAADRMFWYAGWADKYVQVLSSVNPVASSFFNFTIPEPTGVVSLLAPSRSPLLGVVSTFAPIVLSGNTCVVIVENEAPSLAIELAEILATSDVPGGVINILTGYREELLPHVIGHKDVNAIACCGGSVSQRQQIQEGACDTVKRVHFFEEPEQADGWQEPSMQSLYWISPFIEWKTAWHPIGV